MSSTTFKGSPFEINRQLESSWQRGQVRRSPIRARLIKSEILKSELRFKAHFHSDNERLRRKSNGRHGQGFIDNRSIKANAVYRHSARTSLTGERQPTWRRIGTQVRRAKFDGAGFTRSRSIRGKFGGITRRRYGQTVTSSSGCGRPDRCQHLFRRPRRSVIVIGGNH